MTSAYATPDDLIKRYDARVLGDVVNDQNVRVDPTSLLTNPNVLAALDDASGLINSAVLVANKYNPDDLTAMTGIDKALLIRITVDLSLVFLLRRRGLGVEKYPQCEEAMQVLHFIRTGERVFGIAENETAGNPTASFPSFSVYSHLQLMRDVSRYFPTRRNQIVS